MLSSSTLSICLSCHRHPVCTVPWWRWFLPSHNKHLFVSSSFPLKTPPTFDGLTIASHFLPSIFRKVICSWIEVSFPRFSSSLSLFIFFSLCCFILVSLSSISFHFEGRFALSDNLKFLQILDYNSILIYSSLHLSQIQSHFKFQPSQGKFLSSTIHPTTALFRQGDTYPIIILKTNLNICPSEDPPKQATQQAKMAVKDKGETALNMTPAELKLIALGTRFSEGER